MNPVAYLLGVIPALALLLLIIQKLRKGLIKERLALWWIIGSFGALIFGLFPSLLNDVAKDFGVVVPINLAFFIALFLLFLVGIQQSSELSKLEEQTRTLAEHVALLETTIRNNNRE